MAERSAGKDTTTGHWEICGVVLDRPFPLYPDGFPDEALRPFEEAVGRKALCNRPASGTEVIERFGAEHRRSGAPIVYTSGDSVFQIAAHEETVGVDRLYEWCRIARRILRGKHEVSRVIARPFVGEPGNYRRTANRRDFSVEPPTPTLLDRLKEAGLPVVGVGKIEDIFAGRGVTEAIHTEDNRHGIEVTIEAIGRTGEGLIFTNLVDFDSKFGHRNDPKGYAAALEAFDRELPRIQETIGADDLLFITADHGNDPTTPSTDHSREYVPLLAWHPRIRPRDLGTRESFADLGQTIAENFGVRVANGRSFLGEL